MKRSLFTLLATIMMMHQGMAQSRRVMQAEAAYQQEEYSKALTRITKATRHRKTKSDPMVWLLRGKVCQALALATAVDSLHNAYLQQAIDSYRAADTLKNANSSQFPRLLDSLASYYLTEAQQWASQQHYEEALTALNRANMARPDNPPTYLAQANLALQEQDYTLAQQTYAYLLDSLQYDGEDLYEVYRRFINVLALDENNLAKTEVVLQQAQQHFPDSVYWIEQEFALGVNHEQWSKAEELIQNSLLSNATRIEWYRELAHQHRVRNEVDMALGNYLKALALDEENLMILYDLAFLHREEAIAAEKKIGFNPVSIPKMQKEALFHYRESLKYLTRAVSLDNDNDHARQSLTLVKTHIGSLENL